MSRQVQRSPLLCAFLRAYPVGSSRRRPRNPRPVLASLEVDPLFTQAVPGKHSFARCARECVRRAKGCTPCHPPALVHSGQSYGPGLGSNGSESWSSATDFGN